MLYKMLKTAITYNYFLVEDMKNKLNVFFFYNQITEAQYTELMNIVAPPTTTTNTSESTPVT